MIGKPDFNSRALAKPYVQNSARRTPNPNQTPTGSGFGLRGRFGLGGAVMGREEAESIAVFSHLQVIFFCS